MTTILLADDNPGSRELGRVALELAGYRVIEATDGQEAIEFARRETPALIILDIQMPVLDGYAVISELRGDARFAQTPVIAMTAYAMLSDKDKALAAGFTQHVAKPVNVADLRRIVAQLLA
jgi:CheY-like chemotaxis protein